MRFRTRDCTSLFLFHMFITDDIPLARLYKFFYLLFYVPFRKSNRVYLGYIGYNPPEIIICHRILEKITHISQRQNRAVHINNLFRLSCVNECHSQN